MLHSGQGQWLWILYRRMPTPFWLSSNSIVMFALIFMTSTRVPQPQDSIKVCPLPSINIFFIGREERGSRNKLLHGWAAFLNLILLLSTKILLSDLQRPSELNICLANLLHPSLLGDRPALNYHADPSQPAAPPLHISLPLRLYAREKAGLLIWTQWSGLKVFTAKLCFNWLRLKQRPAVRPSFVTEQQGLCWVVGARLSLLMAQLGRTELCPECKPKAPKRSSLVGLM